MRTHTKGPWMVHPMFPRYVIPASEVGKAVGGADDPDVEAARYAKVITLLREPSEYREFHRSRIVDGDEVLANARLIAAAPDLLEACRQMLGVFESMDRALVQATERGAETVHVGDLRQLPRSYVPLLRKVIQLAEPDSILPARPSGGA